jgi:hypothetical protein
MTPVDKATVQEKETVEKEEDLRHEWVEEDLVSDGRKPNLEEIEDDAEIL